jgi:hypothetical protein
VTFCDVSGSGGERSIATVEVWYPTRRNSRWPHFMRTGTVELHVVKSNSRMIFDQATVEGLIDQDSQQ